MDTNKNKYIKPSTQAYDFKMESNLLVASQLRGSVPFKWGNPAFDR
jgi:hypothetical protein